jgi:DMSO/TMAO reductase YedYZ molybdopterin-dependent catalytic subunit
VGWSWEEFRRLPSEQVSADIHCVTRWSKLDTRWEGVSLDTLLAGSPPAAFVGAYCYGGYTINLPLADVTGGKAWAV